LATSSFLFKILRMRVIHFNTYASGGSAVLMRRLHSALRDRGHDSEIRYGEGEIEDTHAKRQYADAGALDALRIRARHSIENRLLRSTAPSYFSCLRSHRVTALEANDRAADLYHLHWVGRWLDLPSFMASIPTPTPIVWTIHDMSPLAGGCFTDFDCEQLGNECRRCPLLRAPFDRWVARQEWQRRDEALRGRKLHIVANSRFTATMVDKSPLMDRPRTLTIIPPGIDTNALTAIDTLAAKRALGIDGNALVIGFGAASITDENKGCGRFLAVAHALGKRVEGVVALTFGDGLPPEVDGVNVKHLGALAKPEELSLAYSAMDALLVTSRMETFGQVAIEAQSCGTPAWGFRVGGLPDAIRPGETGGLVEFGEIERMAEEISEAYRAVRLSTLGEGGMAWVREKFKMAAIAAQYEEVYQRAINSL
jgi:glycosyltransferase involved in cell wall biosynthesis